MRIAVAVVLAVMQAAPLEASLQRAKPGARVRSLERTGRRLLADGMAQSTTFRRLVHRLEQSDVIVYVELRPNLPSSVGGSLRFLTASATDRFLIVHLNRRFAWQALVALLGHELQHAVEIAEAPEVRSAETMRDYYRRVGMRVGEDRFDSMAAREAGYSVRAELAEARGMDRRLARARAASDAILREAAGHTAGSLEGGAEASAVPAEPIGR